MKQKIRKAVIMLTGLLSLTTGIVSAQSRPIAKLDKLIFLNGNAKEGKVTACENGKVQFVHRGETLNYEFNNTEIEKIEFASGRIEFISRKREDQIIIPFGIAKNKVAVLPLGYIGDGHDSKMNNMPFLLQELTVEYLSQSAIALKFKGPAETNALLARAGINESNIRVYTPKELAAILNVEYIIMGTVMQDKGNIVTVDHWHTESRGRTGKDWNRYTERSGRDRDRRYNAMQRSDSHGSSVTRQQIENQVSLSIYNAAGESIYAKSRHSLFSNIDGYKNTLRYLLKRTPLYER